MPELKLGSALLSLRSFPSMTALTRSKVSTSRQQLVDAIDGMIGDARQYGLAGSYAGCVWSADGLKPTWPYTWAWIAVFCLIWNAEGESHACAR
jgi:hypothetical protein